MYVNSQTHAYSIRFIQSVLKDLKMNRVARDGSEKPPLVTRDSRQNAIRVFNHTVQKSRPNSANSSFDAGRSRIHVATSAPDAFPFRSPDLRTSSRGGGGFACARVHLHTYIHTYIECSHSYKLRCIETRRLAVAIGRFDNTVA